MTPVDVPIEDYTFSDGSMNARQYHAWLWAQVPQECQGAHLERMAKVIEALTMKFMLDGMWDDPGPEQRGGLAELLK